MNILVTGASGFIGRRLVELLAADGAVRVRAASREPLIDPLEGVTQTRLSELASDDLGSAVSGIDVVIHLAARVHVMRDTVADALGEFRRVNVRASRRLAEAAVAAGVQRFVFVSSIKVNGEATAIDRPFRSADAARPQDPYGMSKHEAETELRAIAAASGMELTIVRPVLVYGPGVGANFERMMSWLHRGNPLPFGSIDNLRSLLALDNLCDLLITCTRHPAATGQVFLASDQEDVSTPDLLRRLGTALGKPARLFGMPEGALRWLFRSLGQAEAGYRLCGSLRVDGTPLRDLLGWQPPITLDEGLRRASVAFLAARLTQAAGTIEAKVTIAK